MAIALDPKRRVEYTLKAERDKPDATKFILRALTFRERCEVEDEAYEVDMRTGQVLSKVGAMRYANLSRGLVGWVNFKNKKGEQVEFTATPSGAPTEDALGMLGDEHVTELANRIQEMSQVGKADQD